MSREATADVWALAEVPRLPVWAVERIADFDVDDTARAIVDTTMEVVFTEHRFDEELRTAFSASVRENIAGLRRYLLGELQLREVSPVRPVAFAAVQAQLDISITEIERAYRFGARILLREWISEVRSVLLEAEVDVPEGLDVLQLLVTAFFAYQDRVVQEVAAAHAAEEEALRASKAQLRRQTLHRYLRGDLAVEDVELASALDYPVHHHHVAVVVSAADEQQRNKLAGELRGAVAAPTSLLQPVGLSRWALWLSLPGAWSATALDTLLATLRRSAFVASVGRAFPGGAGLRSTLGEAQRAETIRAALGEEAPAVLAFADVELEALLLADLPAAQRFVVDELGALAEDTPLAGQLRETLLVWFASTSHVSTAATLGLHEHTVRNRLHRAEEMIGHPLTTRRTELQVALRLHRVVMPASDDG